MVKITKQRFKQALNGTGGIMLSIANNMGVTREGVYKWIKKHPDMQELRLQEEEKIIDIAENSLFTQAKDKEQWATKYLLSTKGKRRGYTEKQEVEHSGQGITINLVETSVEEILDGKARDKSKAKGDIQSP